MKNGKQENIYIGGSKCALGTHATSLSKFFNFHAVFGKRLRHNRLAHPTWELAHPVGNPGSTTALS